MSLSFYVRTSLRWSKLDWFYDKCILVPCTKHIIAANVAINLRFRSLLIFPIFRFSRSGPGTSNICASASKQFLQIRRDILFLLRKLNFSPILSSNYGMNVEIALSSVSNWENSVPSRLKMSELWVTYQELFYNNENWLCNLKWYHSESVFYDCILPGSL